jgi:hypothetical protein
LKVQRTFGLSLIIFLLLFLSDTARAWYDETHVMIAKSAGYSKWFNAAAADIARMKIGDKELHNHYVNNPRGTVVTAEMVIDQAGSYNTIEKFGHLYGAIIATVRAYLNPKKGEYPEYHLAFCAHYVGDLSQPLHNIEYSPYNKQQHGTNDGIVNKTIFENADKIQIYAIKIGSEQDLAKEIARIGNLSMGLGYKLEAGNRNMTADEAYRQISHSVSLFKAILEYVGHK